MDIKNDKEDWSDCDDGTNYIKHQFDTEKKPQHTNIKVKEIWDDSSSEEESVKASSEEKKPSKREILMEKEKEIEKLKQQALDKVKENSKKETATEEKQRIQESQENSDLKLAVEIFSSEKVDINNLKTVSSFATTITGHLKKFEDSVYYFDLLNEIFTTTAVTCTGEDLTKLINTLNVISNSKIKVNKTKKKKKQKQKETGKPKTIVENEDVYYNEYDDFI